MLINAGPSGAPVAELRRISTIPRIRAVISTGADLQDRDGIGLETVIEVPSEIPCPGDDWHDVPGGSQGVSVLRATRR